MPRRALLVSLAIVLASCARPSPSPVSVATAPSAPAAAVAVAWLDADRGEKYSSDGLTVELVGATVAKVPLESPLGGTALSDDALLIVRVRVTNADADRKAEYKTWGARNFDLTPKPTAVDEKGNKFKIVNFGAGAKVAGSVERSVSLYPGRPIEDVLVFELPLPSSKELHFELPAANVGGAGVIRFRVTSPPGGIAG